MIKIGDKYGISENGSGYSLQKAVVAQSDSVDKKGNVVRKSGEIYWVSMESYHGTVTGCLNALIRILQRTEVSGEDMTLTEARTRFAEIEDTVRAWANVERA